MSNLSKILIHTALLCEAQPFIQTLKLIKNKTVPNVYENETHVLIVSGIGKTATFQALETIFKEYVIHKAFNIGIAGCQDESIAIGTLCCSTHHLNMVLFTTLSTSDTVIEDKKKIKTTLVDMESHYFMQMCQEHLPKEEIYCFKVVSDYLSATIPSKQFVTSIIQQNIFKLKEIL